MTVFWLSEEQETLDGQNERYMRAVLAEESVPPPTGPGAVGGTREPVSEEERRRRRREALHGRTDAGTVGDVDAGGYGVSEGRLRGDVTSLFGAEDSLAEANLIINFEARLHPRDVQGRWAKKFGKLTPQGHDGPTHAQLPDGTRVTAHREGGFAVSRSGRITRHASAEEAAKEALDRSARGKEATSYGGATRHASAEAAHAAMSGDVGVETLRGLGMNGSSFSGIRSTRVGDVTVTRASRDRFQIEGGGSSYSYGTPEEALRAAQAINRRLKGSRDLPPAGTGDRLVSRGHGSPGAETIDRSHTAPERQRGDRVVSRGKGSPGAETIDQGQVVSRAGETRYRDARHLQQSLTTHAVRGKKMPGESYLPSDRKSLHEVRDGSGKTVGYIAKHSDLAVVATGQSRVGHHVRRTDFHVHGPTGKDLGKLDARNGLDGAKRMLADAYHSRHQHQIKVEGGKVSTSQRRSSFGAVETRAHPDARAARRHLGLADHVAFGSGGSDPAAAMRAETARAERENRAARVSTAGTPSARERGHARAAAEVASPERERLLRQLVSARRRMTGPGREAASARERAARLERELTAFDAKQRQPNAARHLGASAAATAEAHAALRSGEKVDVSGLTGAWRVSGIEGNTARVAGVSPGPHAGRVEHVPVARLRRRAR